MKTDVKPLAVLPVTMPEVQVDNPLVPVAAQLPVLARPLEQTYADTMKAVRDTRKELAVMGQNIGSQARATGLAAWAERNDGWMVTTSGVGAILGGVALLIGGIAALTGAPAEVAMFTAAGAAVPGASLWYTLTNGARVKKIVARREQQTVSSKQIAPIAKRIEKLEPSERAALLPSLSATVEQYRKTLSAKAYSDFQDVLEDTTTEASPIAQRAGSLALWIDSTLSSGYVNLGALERTIADAEPDERRVIAKVVENGLFDGESQRATFDQRDEVYAVIRAARRGETRSKTAAA